MGHIILDALRNSILITGLVTVMMMMIESLNIESHGMLFKGLRKTRTGQVVIAALLGSIPGCMGGFATVSLYTHRMFSFGALVAMMIASSGDEAFMMLAMIPHEAMIMLMVLFILAVITGIVTDLLYDKIHVRHCHKHDHSECGAATDCSEGYVIHNDDCCHSDEIASHGSHEHEKARHFGWRRVTLFIGLAVFIAALGSGKLGHDHENHEVHSHSCTEGCTDVHHHHNTEEEHDGRTFHIDLLSEDWMNILFAGLSLLMLFVLLFGSDHFVEEHLWHHIIRKHLPTIFSWTFGVLLLLGILLQYVDINNWISDNTVLMIILATLLGIIPESGPHMIFVTLYAAGIVPFPVLLASCISQDGHASLPLLAESGKSFIWAKTINCIVALAAGFTALALI